MRTRNKLIAIVILAVSAWGCGRNGDHRKKEVCIHEMNRISNIIREAGLMGELSLELTNGAISKNLYLLVENLEVNRLVNFSDDDWKGKSAFVDPWGNDYQFLFVYQGYGRHGYVDGHILKSIVWSPGPNSVDERGGNDDVISHTNTIIIMASNNRKKKVGKGSDRE